MICMYMYILPVAAHVARRVALAVASYRAITCRFVYKYMCVNIYVHICNIYNSCIYIYILPVAPHQRITCVYIYVIYIICVYIHASYQSPPVSLDASLSLSLPVAPSHATPYMYTYVYV